MKVQKALIPAAGMGTRFFPATKVVPKELLPIVDRPAIQIIVEELIASGISEIVFVIHPTKEAVFEHFQKGGVVEELLQSRNKVRLFQPLHKLLNKAKFHKVYQREPLGLGHAVLCGKEVIGDHPFVVVLPDDLVRSKTPCTQQLLNVWEKEKKSVIALEKVPEEKVGLYGIVGGKAVDSTSPFPIEIVVEKPSVEKAPSRWAIIGRYVLTAKVFTWLEKLRPGAIGEIQLTDALSKLIEDEGLMGCPFEGERIDVGQPPGYVAANLIYGSDHRKICEGIQPFLDRLR